MKKWPTYSGINGRYPPELVADMFRNRWTTCSGFCKNNRGYKGNPSYDLVIFMAHTSRDYGMAGAEFYAFLKNDYQAQLAKVRRWLKSLPAGEATYSVEEMTALESIPTNTSIWITQGLARFMRCKATDFIKLDGEGTGASDYPSMKSDNAKKFFLNYWL